MNLKPEQQVRFELVKMFSSQILGMKTEQAEKLITNLATLILAGHISPREDTPRTA